MPRRASSGISPGLLIGVAAATAIAFFAGKALLGKRSEAFADTSPLVVEDFLDNGNSLRGNEYVIEGAIDEKLRWTPDRGEVVSVMVSSKGAQEFIPVEIPPGLSAVNIERERRYAIKVKFRQGGIPVATGINPL